MKEINNGYFTGERSLFNSEDIKINNTIFGEGESPLNLITAASNGNTHYGTAKM